MGDITRKRGREVSDRDAKHHTSTSIEKASTTTEHRSVAPLHRRQGIPVISSHSLHSAGSRVHKGGDKGASSSSFSSLGSKTGCRTKDTVAGSSATWKKAPMVGSPSSSMRSPFTQASHSSPAPPQSRWIGSSSPSSSSSSFPERNEKRKSGGMASTRSSTSSRHSNLHSTPRSSKVEELFPSVPSEKQARIFLLEYAIAQETNVLRWLEARHEATLDAVETMVNAFEAKKNTFLESVRHQEQAHATAMKVLVIRRHRCHTRLKGLKQEEEDMEDRIKNIKSEKEIVSELISMEKRKIQQKEEELVLAKEKTESGREKRRLLEAEAKLLEGDSYGLTGEVKELVLQTKAVERNTASILEESMKLEVIRRELFSEAEALKGSIRVFGRVRGKHLLASSFPWCDDRVESRGAGGGSSSSVNRTPLNSARSSTTKIDGEEGRKHEEEGECVGESDRELDFFSSDAAIQRLQGLKMTTEEGGVLPRKMGTQASSSALPSLKAGGMRRAERGKDVSNPGKYRRGLYLFKGKPLSERKGVSDVRSNEQKPSSVVPREKRAREEDGMEEASTAPHCSPLEVEDEVEPLLFTFGLAREDQMMTELETQGERPARGTSERREEKVTNEAGRLAFSQVSSGGAGGAPQTVVTDGRGEEDANQTSVSFSSVPFRTITIHQTRCNATSTGDNATTETFTFDRVFDGKATQIEVYEPIEPLILNAMDGYSICIFAYGQTGSGKTFSMEGHTSSPELLGIIPRAMQTILSRVEALKEEGWAYTIRCSLLEIYNDTIRDLLQPTALYDKGGAAFQQTQYHVIQHHMEDHTTTVTRIKEERITNMNDFWQVYKEAVRHRRTAATILNAQSSRSHCIFLLHLDGVNQTIRERSAGKLCLVDLAGSERVLESGVKGDQLKEAININKSLMNLGKCISAMRTSEVVPWRNSKLTYFLQNYLGAKGGKMLMLVTVSDKREHASESVNALRFATRVSETVVGPSIKRVVKF